MDQDSGYSSLKFRRPSTKLHRGAPGSRTLRSQASTPALKRYPSAPINSSATGRNRDQLLRSRSNAQHGIGVGIDGIDGGSAGSLPYSLDQSTPTASTSNDSSHTVSSYNSSSPFFTDPFFSEKAAASDDSVAGTPSPFEARTMLDALEETPSESEPFSEKRPVVMRSNHTSPNLGRSNTLRQSSSFTALQQSRNGLQRTGTERVKRYSDDEHSSSSRIPGRPKKNSFSNFMTNVLGGAPRSNFKISAPANPVHVTHVGYDNKTGQFTGLPREWQRLLEESGISRKEQEEHPQTMVDIMRFYEKSTKGDNDEAVWHKFDHAIPNAQQSAAAYPNSHRFPQSHGRSFENPRAPPPIPRAPATGLVPSRAAPKPPVLNVGGPLPSRPPPQPPVPHSTLPSRPPQDPFAYQHPLEENGMSTLTQANTAVGSNRFQATAPSTEKQLERSRSQQQHQQQPPAAANATQQSPDARGPPSSARPRQRSRQSNGFDIRARLLSICAAGDPTTKYYNLSKIGQGASGGVFTAYETGTKRCVAIKQMNLDLQPKKDLIVNEILVMKDSKHRNIVNFLESYLHGQDLWVVMEYMEGGSLTDVVTFNIMSEGQIAAVCREVSLPLCVCHIGW